MKNWKTTLCGAITALGVYFATVTDPPWLATVGQVMTGLGAFMTGMFAKDSNVTGAGASATTAKQ